MLIALTTDVYHPMMSGVTRVIDIFIEELPKYGIRYELYAPAIQKPAISFSRLDGGLLIKLKAFRLFGIYKEMPVPEPFSTMLALKNNVKKLILEDTIIHAHTPYVATTVLRVATSRIKSKLPIILTYHTLVNKYIDYRFGRGGAFMKIADKAFLNNVFIRCNYIVFPSKYALEVTKHYVGDKKFEKIKSKFVLIRNPVPRHIYDKPKKHVSEYYEFLEGYDYAIWVGRISHEKNLPFILKMFAGLPYKLIIAGKGPLLEPLKRIAPKNVKFLGFVPDEALKSLLYYSRLMIIASSFDNMPLAVLEAMAQGVPIVSYYKGGHNEIIEDGYNGYKYKNLHKARNVIKKIFEDDTLRETLGHGARETALKFHPDKIIPKYIRLYEKVAR